MANTITLTNAGINSGTAVKLLHGAFSYGWKNLVKADPANSSYSSVEAQFSGWENPTMNLTFHIPVESIPSDTMTWALWNQFVKNQYAGTAATQTRLAITVGSNDTQFGDYSTSTVAVTAIPIQIDEFSLIFSPVESSNAGFWTINAQVKVTA